MSICKHINISIYQNINALIYQYIKISPPLPLHIPPRCPEGEVLRSITCFRVVLDPRSRRRPSPSRGTHGSAHHCSRACPRSIRIVGRKTVLLWRPCPDEAIWSRFCRVICLEKQFQLWVFDKECLLTSASTVASFSILNFWFTSCPFGWGGVHKIIPEWP